MAYKQLASGEIRDEQGNLIQGAYDISKGIMPSTQKNGEYLTGVKDGELVFGGIQLPDQPGLPNQAGEIETPGVSLSKPAINRTDYEAQVKKEFAGGRTALEKSYEQRIAEAQGLSGEQKSTLEAGLGAKRRFSSSAQAFISYIDEKNKKAIANLEVQRDEALANFDFKMAEMVEKRIAAERQNAQQDFENTLKMIDYSQKLEEQKAKKKEQLITSSREQAISNIISQGIDDPTKIQNIVNYDEAGNQIGDIKLEEITGVLDKIQTFNKGLIGDVVASGITGVSGVYNELKKQGKSITVSQVADTLKEIRDAETSAPGIVGEWLAAKENDPTLVDSTLADYVKTKNPELALSMEEKRLNIEKLKREALGGVIDSNNKIILPADKARSINDEIVKNDAYKAIDKGQTALQYLSDLENTFSETGLETLPGSAKGELSSKYTTTLLNLKEFFNLGVLNGPDLTVMQGIIPDPTTGFFKKFRGRASAVEEGIKTMKQNINDTLDERYATLSTQYGSYSPTSVTALADLNRKYVDQKYQLNPNIKKLVDENPNLTDEEIIKIIQVL